MKMSGARAASTLAPTRRGRYIGSMLQRMIFGRPLHALIFTLSLFCLFVAVGLTGSSVDVGFHQNPFIINDHHSLIGHAKPIRGDEWAIFAPMALAQLSHQPQFPVVNNNIGLEGQNMLIIGLTGMPVLHSSALSKPATWGFFLFDMRRALAWYWWMPIIGAFLAFWWLLYLLDPNLWKEAYFLSLIFCLSAYVAAWSNWPAYCMFFPTLASALFVSLWRSKTWRVSLFCAIGIGLAVPGFAFTLYPPYQVSLGYFFLFLLFGLAIDERKTVRLKPLAVFSIVAALIAGAILFNWWIDAQEAIAKITATVYPGQRTALLGGDYSWSQFLIGFTNFGSLYKLDSNQTNYCEVSSFYYFLLPVLGLGILKARSKGLSWVEKMAALFFALVLVFLLIGFPKEVSQYSLWGRIPSSRTILATATCYFVLTYLLMRHKGAWGTRWALAIALLWTAFVGFEIKRLPAGYVVGFNDLTYLLLAIFTTACGYFLLKGNKKWFLITSLVMVFATTYKFNPVSIAPSYFSLAQEISTKLEKNDRVLHLGSQVNANFSIAAGVASVNGVLFYPQFSLWKQLDPEGTYRDIYNRYQHLIFTGTNDVGLLAGRSVTITSPQPDVVQVFIDPTKFDFSLTGATIVSAPISQVDRLAENQGLRLLVSSHDYVWFRVHPVAAKN